MMLEPGQAIIWQLLDIYIVDEEYIQDENSFLSRLYADHLEY